jgi:hypothetical protein
MHFSFNLLRIKDLYMFRALLAHPQEALNKRHLVYCCPEHVEEIKLHTLSHLVGSLSSLCLRCTVTWTSNTLSNFMNTPKKNTKNRTIFISGLRFELLTSRMQPDVQQCSVIHQAARCTVLLNSVCCVLCVIHAQSCCVSVPSDILNWHKRIPSLIFIWQWIIVIGSHAAPASTEKYSTVFKKPLLVQRVNIYSFIAFLWCIFW